MAHASVHMSSTSWTQRATKRRQREKKKQGMKLGGRLGRIQELGKSSNEYDQNTSHMCMKSSKSKKKNISSSLHDQISPTQTSSPLGYLDHPAVWIFPWEQGNLNCTGPHKRIVEAHVWFRNFPCPLWPES